jgi:Gram-negative bacterial TonB protein C-terminal
MKSALALLTLLVIPVPAFAQDVKVREQAEHLLERANAVSSSPHLPNLERIDTFRVFEEGAVKEGSFTRVVVQGTGRREEFTYGDYHLLNVWTQKQVAVVGSSRLLPPQLLNVLRITPINLVRFDGEDVIHSITERDVNGVAARCIGFDTVKGERADHNELCVDAANGTLVLERLAGEVIENSEFFPFAGAWMPGKISYTVGGVRTIEITQTMAPLTDADPNVLVAPQNAQIHGICTTYRRPFGVSMPQPNAGNGAGTVDIVVRGQVGVDGKMHDLAVQSSERPELNAEAIAQAQQWTFTPAMCNGKPDVHEAAITLHFQGR